MASPQDSRRNVPAANADILGDDAAYQVAPEKAQPDGEERHGEQRATDPRPGGPAGGSGVRREMGGRPESGAAAAGKDINQAGFIKKADGETP